DRRPMGLGRHPGRRRSIDHSKARLPSPLVLRVLRAPSDAGFWTLVPHPCAPICGPCAKGSSMNNQLADLEERVKARLNAVKDPLSGKDLFTSGRVIGLEVREGGKVSFTIEAPADAAERFIETRDQAEAAARAARGVTSVIAVLTAHEAKPASAGGI